MRRQRSYNACRDLHRQRGRTNCPRLEKRTLLCPNAPVVHVLFGHVVSSWTLDYCRWISRPHTGTGLKIWLPSVLRLKVCAAALRSATRTYELNTTHSSARLSKSTRASENTSRAKCAHVAVAGISFKDPPPPLRRYQSLSIAWLLLSAVEKKKILGSEKQICRSSARLKKFDDIIPAQSCSGILFSDRARPTLGQSDNCRGHKKSAPAPPTPAF